MIDISYKYVYNALYSSVLYEAVLVNLSSILCKFYTFYNMTLASFHV